MGDPSAGEAEGGVAPSSGVEQVEAADEYDGTDEASHMDALSCERKLWSHGVTLIIPPPAPGGLGAPTALPLCREVACCQRAIAMLCVDSEKAECCCWAGAHGALGSIARGCSVVTG